MQEAKVFVAKPDFLIAMQINIGPLTKKALNARPGIVFSSAGSHRYRPDQRLTRRDPRVTTYHSICRRSGTREATASLPSTPPLPTRPTRPYGAPGDPRESILAHRPILPQSFCRVSAGKAPPLVTVWPGASAPGYTTTPAQPGFFSPMNGALFSRPAESLASGRGGGRDFTNRVIHIQAESANVM